MVQPSSGPKAARSLIAAAMVLTLNVVLAGAARAQMAPPGGPGTCQGGGTASAGNCPSWGGYIKPMPGTVCTMNVGNNNLHDGYTNKVRNCSEILDRRNGVSGDACDVINLIELNSDLQCGCACNPANACAVWTSDHEWCLQDAPGRPPECDGQGYYDAARCELCKGCGAGKPPGCFAQAEIVCDPQQYTISCPQVGDKGCDCLCVKKGPCGVGAGSCVGAWIQNPPSLDCDSGNYAVCQKCDYDGDGRYDFGACTAHPTHCNGVGYVVPPLRQACLERCSTPILEGAAQFIADARIRVISGDLNCDPRPDPACNVPNPLWPPVPPPTIRLFGQCPWVSTLQGYGLEICNYSEATTLGVCAVDLVLSNACGCGSQSNRQVASGDHSTIVFRSTPEAWAGPFTEILSAESATNCPEPNQHSYTSDMFGTAAYCPAIENGQAVPACSAWGHTYSAKLRYDTRVDECFLDPDQGLPPVLVCDIATANAWAHCSPNASSGASSFVTVGVADASQGATCVNGVPYNPPSKVVQKPEIVIPGLVERDGILFFRVERDAHRDRGAECNAPLPSGPCTVPPEDISLSSLFGRSLLGNRVEAVCAEAVEDTQE